MMDIRRFILLIATCVIFAVFSPGTAHAAEFTRVVGAFYNDDPFQADVDVTIEGFQKWGTVTREYNVNGTMIDAAGLSYSESMFTLVPRADIGIFKGLEIFFEFPVVMQWTREVSLDQSIKRDAGGRYTNFTMNRENQPNYTKSDWIVNGAGSVSRSGFGDMSVGVRWAVFNDQRPTYTLKREKDSKDNPIWWDDTLATWILEFMYTAPTGTRIVPAGNSGVGLGAHQFTFSTALSKRFRYMDPYFGISSCFQVSQGPDDPSQISYYKYVRPGQVGSMIVGTEIIPYEKHALGYKVALDIRFGMKYISGGDSDYTEMADFFPGTTFFQKDASGNYVRDSNGYPIIQNPTDFGRLTGREQYLQFYGGIGFYFIAAKYFKLSTSVDLGHDTLHFITFDPIGIDKNGNGRFNPAEGDVPNPNYEGELDQRGYRFRIMDTFLISWSVMLSGQF